MSLKRELEGITDSVRRAEDELDFLISTSTNDDGLELFTAESGLLKLRDAIDDLEELIFHAEYEEGGSDA